MSLAELKADAKLLREHLSTQDPKQLDMQHELVENVLPLIEGLIEKIQKGLEVEVAELAEAVDALIDGDGDMLHPETAAKFVAVLEVGKLIAKELEGAMPKLDDMAKKRVRKLVKAFSQGAEVLMEVLQEITMPLDPEPVEQAEPEADAQTGEFDEVAAAVDGNYDDDDAIIGGEAG